MLSTKQIEQCIIWACVNEVNAPKPGNVNCFSDAKDMQVKDFINSAHAIAPILSNAMLSVGEMILQSILATRQVVDTNTNLGIVLLFAPLCKAAQQATNFDELQVKLAIVLKNLTVDDAIKAYEAIRTAQAGGMGKALDQDIDDTPSVTLLDAMEIAENYDSIAAQYTNNFNDVYEMGVQKLTDALICGESIEWATTFAYLTLINNIPDSLISRKYGSDCAKSVSNKAQKILENLQKNNVLSPSKDEVLTWDKELKKKAINPGTSADLTAATLLVYALRQSLSNKEFQ